MKKIFRMALVCALAGATLLYTGCTKDYSEDISELQKRLDNVEGTQIKNLQDQVTALQQAKSALEAADAKASQAITALETSVSGLQGQIKNLQSSVNQNADDIATINGKIKSINDQITAINGQIDGLKGRISANEEAIKTINAELAKKADKTYVDTELAKKADRTWVEETLKNYATTKELADLESKLLAKIDEINTTILGIQNDIADLKESKLDNAEFKNWLANDFKKVTDDLAAAKNDIVDLKAAVKKAQDDATQALTNAATNAQKISDIEEALKLYAKTKWVEEVINDMKEEFNAELAKKLDIAAYKQDTVKIYDAIRDVDQAVKDVIVAYKAADETLQANINNLETKMNEALALKLDKATFEEFCNNLSSQLSGIEANLGKVFNRIQSVVYVPEYNDSKITLNYAVLLPNMSNIFSATSEVEGEDLEAEIDIEGTTPDVFVETTSTVKYRIYGENASGIVESLVAAVNNEVAANGYSSTLTFDVVRVKTRVNLEGAEVLVVGAEVDDLNPDIISLTIAPRNLGDNFYSSTLATSAYQNLPNYSMSLVVTNAEESKLITSEYENIVPATLPDAITVTILDGEEENITNSLWAEFVQIPYTDTDAHELLAGHSLSFNYLGEDYTYDEIVAENVNVPAPVCTIIDAKENFQWAIDKNAITVDDYVVIDADDTVVPGTATATLGEVCPGGVFTYNWVCFKYNVGLLPIYSGSLVKVVPVQVNVETEIWESDDVEAFTWAYNDDAKGDKDAVANPYYRKDAVVKYEDSELQKLVACGLEPMSLKNIAPTTLTIKAVKGEETTDVTADVAISTTFADGNITADVTNFSFDVDKYLIEATYYYPSIWKPAVQINVKSSFVISDRDREPIVITLPVTEKDFVLNFNYSIPDVFADAEIVKTFAEHSLKNAEVTDAFNKPFVSEKDVISVAIKGNGSLENEVNDMGIDVVGNEQNVLNFTTTYSANNAIFTGKEFVPSADFKTEIVLWYGQKVIVNKKVNVNVDGIYDFERIPEYVSYNSADDCFTTLQPWWQPEGATVAPYTVAVNAYDAHKVLLNQQFRVIDYKNEAVCTELTGELKPEYSFLSRIFKLEEPNGTQVDEIADPRNIPTVTVPDATGVKVANNIVEYYSKSAQEDVIGNLYVVNDNNSTVALTTSFNGSKVSAEDYSNYVIKLYDPLQAITYPEEVQRLNINNSQVFETSIYEFLSLKDKRDFEIIDAKQPKGWVLGNDNNGFEAGVYTNDVYKLVFTNKMTYTSEVSPETKNRISFDVETGKLTYKNELQTQLAEPIDIELAINVEYPWGTRTATVKVQFYNQPVGE